MADLEFREHQRVTIQEITQVAEVSRMTLSKMANHYGANVQTDVLDKLCIYFSCRIEDGVKHVLDDSGNHPNISQ